MKYLSAITAVVALMFVAMCHPAFATSLIGNTDNSIHNTNSNTNNNVNANVNSNKNTAVSSSKSNSSSKSSAASVSHSGAASKSQSKSKADNNSQNNLSFGDSLEAASSAGTVVLTSSNDTCMGSVGVGGQGMSFGFNVGTTWTDEHCQTLKAGRELIINLNDPEAAKARYCMDSKIREAYRLVNRPCPQDMVVVIGREGITTPRRLIAPE